ncbi:bifunctional DNA primase/polymerase [Streptomyces laculatispora]|uniref:bifunctional DNA primase/polymerase n=1 Tax=Streptomyces laculatispora TaxID=887464 RepID=UPI001A93C46C|nr:bifunctional DNA primase/polymerase [Streptomyces laculatispora]MBO0917509.1 bifunctional DNA primase/polymerase [Streptomyces laculatispora]
MNDGTKIPKNHRDAALAYAALGIKVFRVRRSKAPYANCARCDIKSSIYIKHRPEECQCGVATCHGFHAATTDTNLIRRWWTEEPDANIGAPCKLNGWAVLDVDPRNDGHTSLCALEQRVGVLPGTTMQITGGDGLHMLYLSPGFDLPGEPFPGIDFKHNGYILLAPSVHSSGCRYQWPGTGNVFHKPTTAWPSTLLPRKEKPRVPGQARRQTSLSGIRRPGKHWTVETLVQHVMDAGEGNRNASLYFAACRANESADQGALDLYEAENALVSAGQAVGLADGEILATIQSAARRPSDRTWVAA